MWVMSGNRLVSWALAAGAGALVYKYCLRPRYMRWGATDHEVSRDLPGDELTSNWAWQATRAVTINAPVEAVWPWLMQVGQDRGGSYSYAWLDNLPGGGSHAAGTIVPEWHDRRVGDSVWLARPDRLGGAARQVVAAIEPGHYMALVSPAKAERLTTGDPGGEGARVFVLEPIGEGATRLLIRTRAGENTGLLRWLYTFFVFDPAHFVMERKMMLGIKERAEALARHA